MLQATGLRVERAGGLGRGGGAQVLRVAHRRWKVVVSAAAKAKPRIMRLRRDEVAQVLPWTGSGEQRLQKLGTPATWLTRLAISLAGSAVFYNYNTMAAAMASLYWAWDPLVSTTFANTALRLQYPYAGLWRARVLAAKVVKPSPRPRRDDVFQEIFEAQSFVRKPFLKLVIGDGSSATLEMKVALPGKKTLVQVGQTVEVLVLSDIKSLSRFMAVRDVYLPEIGVWLSEDPCIERPVFEELVETLRAAPAVEERDAQPVKARLPDSVDMMPARDLERPNAKRWRLTQLDYEEFDTAVDEDPKLQALRRLNQAQNDGPRRQYMEMQEYSSDSEDFWEQDKVRASVDDEDDAQDDEEEPKLQPPSRLGQEPKKLELQRNLQADGYGPPMQYMRMQEYGSANSEPSEQLKEPEVLVGDESDAQAPVDNAAEQLTTVDEFLGEVRNRDAELVQEEEF